jgi:rhodanese-related sulfurtransferase
MKAMKRLAVVGAIAFAVPVSGRASSGATASQARAASEQGSRIASTGIVPGVVDGEVAHTLVTAGITVVDVRTPAEFASGHVPGAVNIPYDEMARRYGELGPPSTAVLIYCKTGRRSGLATTTLREKGFTQIYDLQSYDNWVLVDAAPAVR